MDVKSENYRFVLSPAQRKARRRRNAAIAIFLGCCAILFYAVTITKFGQGLLNQPLSQLRRTSAR